MTRFPLHTYQIFERLVELTEPICREMDAELSDCLIYDTTEIESHVAENNPNMDPYRAVYGLLPDCAAANPAIKQQYINGHFCYALGSLNYPL